MYIIETGENRLLVNIMEIENKHIEDLIYSYHGEYISEEGRNELLQWLETDDAHKQCFPRWQIVGRTAYLCLPLI